MLIEQIIEFQLRGPGDLWQYMYSYSRLFLRQNKNLQKKSSSGLLFTAEILQEARYTLLPSSHYLGQITYKI